MRSSSSFPGALTWVLSVPAEEPDACMRVVGLVVRCLHPLPTRELLVIATVGTKDHFLEKKGREEFVSCACTSFSVSSSSCILCSSCFEMVIGCVGVLGCCGLVSCPLPLRDQIRDEILAFPGALISSCQRGRCRVRRKMEVRLEVKTGHLVES